MPPKTTNITPGQLSKALKNVKIAETKLNAARAERDALILRALDAGWETGQIASLAGVTPGRVTQIKNEQGERR